MLSRAKSQQCRILARVFERAGRAGYDGRRFVDGFMASKVSDDFFSDYDRLQWLGEGYLFDEATDALGLKPDATTAVTNPEAMYWTGYVYRWWNYVTGENNRQISAMANAETMFGVYDGYHTLSPDEAISRLKEEAR